MPLSDLVTPKVDCVKSKDNYARFFAEPLERGFGVTLGNNLRRVLLSSLLGAAVNWVRIEGIQHEFSTIPHVKEDAIEFLLNVRALRLRSVTKQPGKLLLEVEGEREVYAADINPSADFDIANPELYLATLDSSEAKLCVEFNVILGKGYKPASHGEGLPIGTIPVDAIFTPIRKVNYLVEPTRVGPRTGYEKLILDVWTDGTISPQEALSQSAEILSNQFSFFISFDQASTDDTDEGAPSSVPSEQYELPLENLKLPPRIFNCLRRNNIHKVGELLEKSESELLSLRKLGQKSLEEVKQCLEDLGLSLRSEGEKDEA
jgi:DNA-directed RNA polymerase subunit alpha